MRRSKGLVTRLSLYCAAFLSLYLAIIITGVLISGVRSVQIPLPRIFIEWIETILIHEAYAWIYPIVLSLFGILFAYLGWK